MVAVPISGLIYSIPRATVRIEAGSNPNLLCSAFRGVDAPKASILILERPHWAASRAMVRFPAASQHCWLPLSYADLAEVFADIHRWLFCRSTMAASLAAQPGAGGLCMGTPYRSPSTLNALDALIDTDAVARGTIAQNVER